MAIPTNGRKATPDQKQKVLTSSKKACGLSASPKHSEIPLFERVFLLQ